MFNSSLASFSSLSSFHLLSSSLLFVITPSKTHLSPKSLPSSSSHSFSHSPLFTRAKIFLLRCSLWVSHRSGLVVQSAADRVGASFKKAVADKYAKGYVRDD